MPEHWRYFIYGVAISSAVTAIIIGFAADIVLSRMHSQLNSLKRDLNELLRDKRGKGGGI